MLFPYRFYALKYNITSAEVCQEVGKVWWIFLLVFGAVFTIFSPCSREIFFLNIRGSIKSLLENESDFLPCSRSISAINCRSDLLLFLVAITIKILPTSWWLNALRYSLRVKICFENDVITRSWALSG